MLFFSELIYTEIFNHCSCQRSDTFIFIEFCSHIPEFDEYFLNSIFRLFLIPEDAESITVKITVMLPDEVIKISSGHTRDKQIKLFL
jgi:hypothetical protein